MEFFTVPSNKTTPFAELASLILFDVIVEAVVSTSLAPTLIDVDPTIDPEVNVPDTEAFPNTDNASVNIDVTWDITVPTDFVAPSINPTNALDWTVSPTFPPMFPDTLDPSIPAIFALLIVPEISDSVTEFLFANEPNPDKVVLIPSTDVPKFDTFEFCCC